VLIQQRIEQVTDVGFFIISSDPDTAPQLRMVLQTGLRSSGWTHYNTRAEQSDKSVWMFDVGMFDVHRALGRFGDFGPGDYNRDHDPDTT
jgi:hypothetical protein